MEMREAHPYPDRGEASTAAHRVDRVRTWLRPTDELITRPTAARVRGAVP